MWLVGSILFIWSIWPVMMAGPENPSGEPKKLEKPDRPDEPDEQERRARRVKRDLNLSLQPHPHSARRLVWSPLRASSDHRFIVGALRAQGPYQLPRHPLLSVRILRARRAPGRSFPILFFGQRVETFIDMDKAGSAGCTLMEATYVPPPVDEMHHALGNLNSISMRHPHCRF